MPGETITLDGSLSTDFENSPMKYEWQLGDGNRATGQKVSHAYESSGRYWATLKVTDTSNSPCNWDTDQVAIWVNAPPIVDAGRNEIVAINETISFDGSKSFDPDGNIVRYIWDFGNGDSLEGPQGRISLSKVWNLPSHLDSL